MKSEDVAELAKATIILSCLAAKVNISPRARPRPVFLLKQSHG
jgi:hypothetical protein